MWFVRKIILLCLDCRLHSLVSLTQFFGWINRNDCYGIFYNASSSTTYDGSLPFLKRGPKKSAKRSARAPRASIELFWRKKREKKLQMRGHGGDWRERVREGRRRTVIGTSFRSPTWSHSAHLSALGRENNEKKPILILNFRQQAEKRANNRRQ